VTAAAAVDGRDAHGGCDPAGDFADATP